MAKESARSAARAVAVLEYLTTNSQRSFTLSQLSAAIDVSMSSLSAVLQALLNGGFIVRHPRHKTYELGPALLAVGRAAASQHPVVDLARPQLAGFAEEFDAECVGSMVVGDQILIVTLEGKPTNRTRGLALGQKVPFTPPFGEVWVAYNGPKGVKEWLDSIDEGSIDEGSIDEGSIEDGGTKKDSGGEDINTEEMTEHLHQVLHQIRTRGCAVNLKSEYLTAYTEAIDLSLRRPANELLRQRASEILSMVGSDYHLLDENPDEVYEVQMVVAPVFDADSMVVFTISLLGLAERTGSEIARIAERLIDTGLTLTRAIGGRPPLIDAERTAG